MGTFSPVTDADLARARHDPAFRHQLLSQNLDALLSGLGKLRSSAPSVRESGNPDKLREGVALAVRLAELIQKPKNAA